MPRDLAGSGLPDAPACPACRRRMALVRGHSREEEFSIFECPSCEEVLVLHDRRLSEIRRLDLKIAELEFKIDQQERLVLSLKAHGLDSELGEVLLNTLRQSRPIVRELRAVRQQSWRSK